MLSELSNEASLASNLPGLSFGLTPFGAMIIALYLVQIAVSLLILTGRIRSAAVSAPPSPSSQTKPSGLRLSVAASATALSMVLVYGFSGLPNLMRTSMRMALW